MRDVMDETATDSPNKMKLDSETLAKEDQGKNSTKVWLR